MPRKLAGLLAMEEEATLITVMAKVALAEDAVEVEAVAVITKVAVEADIHLTWDTIPPKNAKAFVVPRELGFPNLAMLQACLRMIMAMIIVEELEL
jgi:hypothetical protein